MTVDPAVVTLLISGLGVAWTIIHQSGERRDRRRAERTEQAGRILELMQGMGTAGMDPKLDPATSMRTHERELHRLRRIIRNGAAEFSDKELPLDGPSPLLGTVTVWSAFAFVYGVLLLILTEEGQSTAERAATVLTGVFLFTVGISGLLTALARWEHRSRARGTLTRAGLELLERRNSTWQDLRAFRLKRLRARMRRRRSREARKILRSGRKKD
ncbi:hypothetical protein BFL35_05840 [Clavibacter michiganensis]|uniref:Uncharacterized protein n=1 Tax=Clavibacter michiganensis TaxID=28447 RepID=A0A251Y6T7_9MICO|nr:hypothetical protein [Clavibacter michiganensis]OUE19996.1 hypothetical protein BFL34_02144 [Clavibacter michiganensis]OUE31280.1 hypothetical protein BFL35_05840 [Clavibacter michiganensis]